MYSKDTHHQTSERALTPLMIEGLMECHERELQNLEPHEAWEFHSTRGLFLRKMVETKWYINKEGKKFLAVFLTNHGRKFLREYSN